LKPRHRDHPECRAISDVLQRVGDKWTVLVVSQLGERTMRFNELRRTIGNISQKMLTTTLRDLEQDGFVTRTVYPEIPPRVEYALTDLGRDLLEPVLGLVSWAKENRERMEAAKQRYETRLAAE
jgi:DNA-binding HxlR family transcriptional regulator